MVRHPPRPRGDVATPATGAPLIITAELPGEIQSYADGLRRAHYPADRNYVPAHVTLFRGLPPSCEGELRELLSIHANLAPPDATLVGTRTLGTGTALELRSDGLLDIWGALKERLRALLSPSDTVVPRLHITIQNHVPAREAKALKAALELDFHPRRFRFAGLAIHAWQGGPWELVKRCSFRG